MTAKTLQFYADEWKTLPWKKFQKNLFRLQHRIYKAAKSEDKSTVKQLQSLLIGSKCSKYLAVRQVTQLNSGKKTCGVDGVSSLNPKQRIALTEDLKSMRVWKHQKLRRVFIPKANGKKRPLGIPTIRDRAMQCLIKYALEPVYEALASDGSYGFRPGHSTWDVQGRIFQNLKSNAHGYAKRILELDIEGCFDNINHEKLMSLVTLPGAATKFLWSALRAGVLRERETTKTGTPQGGVISPLLCNIALHGVEDLHNEWVYRSRWHQKGLRYADDMIFILNEDESWNELFNKVKEFLMTRGLKPQEAKTRLVSSKEGFDFLGWHFKVKAGNNKFVCYPSKDSVQSLKMRIKQVLKDSRYKLTDRINMLKTVYRGWWNYHQFCDMRQIKSTLWAISQWTYKYINKNSNIPGKEASQLAGSIYNGHSYKVNRSPSVRGNKSVYDHDIEFWSKRNAKYYTGPLLKTLKKQDYRCNSCNLKILTTDKAELHHIDGNNKNNKPSNIEVLHRSCHQYQPIHGDIRRKSNRLMN
jgi:group II intron reverse transcriptase/maturase